MGALKQSNINRFRNRGYRSYAEYLASDHWARVRRAYRDSGRPMDCAACGARPIELHHRSYSRICGERLNDLIPLCRGCHGRVHDYINANDGQVVQATPAILRRVFGWTKAETRARMAPFDADDGRQTIL